MFPALHVSTQELVAERDKVVERWIQTCTDTGTPFFIRNIQAAGRKVTTTDISICRITNGKIAEHWGEFDFAAVLRQIGVTYGAT
jgi:predicted ester cyclase